MHNPESNEQSENHTSNKKNMPSSSGKLFRKQKLYLIIDITIVIIVFIITMMVLIVQHQFIIVQHQL